MATILAYLITVQTSHAKKKRLPNDSLHFLEKQLKICSNLRKNVADPGCASFDSILIAPEYLFSEYKNGGVWYGFYHNPAGRQRIPIAEKDSKSLLIKLKEISKKYPKTIIIPGTVFHSQAVKTDTEKLHVAHTNVIREFRATEVRGTDIRLLNYKDPKKSATNAGGELKELGQKMKKKEGVKTARNSCFILHAGELVHRYDKETGFNENYDDPKGKGFFVSVNMDDCFTVDGLRFGVEICFDHNQGCLKSKNHEDIFFHIVVSDAVEQKIANMAMKDGGYFIHSSSHEPYTMVVKNDSGNKWWLPPNPKHLYHGEGYKAYVLDNLPDIAEPKISYKKGKIPLPGLFKK